MKNEKKFWNNSKVIAWFATEPAPKYWEVFFRKMRKKEETQKVLDLGCGAGRNTEMLLRLRYDVYACDFYAGMVRATIDRLQKLRIKKDYIKERVKKASMLNLPYADGFFDAIVANGVYHNVSSRDELGKALSESARVLKPGGDLCFNLFSSKIIASNLVKLEKRKDTYLTEEGLFMVLTSRKYFLNLAAEYNLKLCGKTVEYERKVSTGRRFVVRGVLKKNH